MQPAPTIRITAFQELFDNLSQVDREKLSNALRFLVADYLGADEKNIDMILMQFAEVYNGYPSSLFSSFRNLDIQVMLIAPPFWEEVYLPERETIQDLVSQLRGYLLSTELLPKGMVVGIWITPIIGACYNEAVRIDDETNTAE